jgi:hypothetical protein
VTTRFTIVVSDGIVAPVTDSTTSVIATTTITGVTSLVLAAGDSIDYVAGGPPVALDPGLSISDPESTSLIGAAISIGAGFLAGDALSVGSPQAGITSGYNATTGVLTLSGKASLAAYQTELDSVAFASSSATNPGARSLGRSAVVLRPLLQAATCRSSSIIPIWISRCRTQTASWRCGR